MSNARYLLKSIQARPFFAEVPYYLWDEVNYDSEGNCSRPTDQTWTELHLRNRQSKESLSIECNDTHWSIEGSEPVASRAAYFFIHRCSAESVDHDPAQSIGNWDHAKAWSRSLLVQDAFSRPELKPFDNYLFFGSWKWISWFGTDFTWVGRWIMQSVLSHDQRAVFLCADWLRQGTVNEEQALALTQSLSLLTGLPPKSPEEWICWYEQEGSKQFQKPNFEQWRSEVKK